MSNLKGLVSGLLTAAAVFAAQQAGAQQESHEEHLHREGHQAHDIEEVIVRATPLDRDLVEISQSATVLSGEDLYREVGNNIGETLTRQAGLANASFGQNVGRPVIRGLQGQRVGVLTNNMAASDASAVSQDHAVAVEPFLADQVEVLRGPSTLLYGSGAIGGVVNIVSHSIPQEIPEEGFEGRALAQVDSAADQRFAAGRLDFGGSSFAFHADMFYRRTDDYEIPGRSELYPEDEHEEHEEEATSGILENSFLDNEGGALGASWIGERWRAGLSWTAYDADYGIPGAHHHHEEEGGEEHDEEHEGEEEELVTVGLESRRWDAEVVGSDPFTGFEQLKFRYANTAYTHTEFEGEEVGTLFDSDTDDARLELRHNTWGRWAGAFGLQYTDVDFSAFGEEAFVPPSNTETGALFWIESVEFERWQFDLGLRYESIDVTALELLAHPHEEEESGHEGESARRSFNPFSISAGAIWHVTEASHLTANLSRAERAPTAQELYSFGPHVASQTFEIGNSQLQEESNLHFEAGYRIHGERLSGSLILYADRFDDFIYQQNAGEEEDGFPVRLWSQQDADFVGAEVELRFDIGHYDSGHWWVFGLFDTVSGELDDGQNVPLMPPTRFGLGLDWHFRSWTANLTWIRADDHTDVAEYETPTPGYDLLNLDVAWSLPWFERSSWELFLKGHNLLDEDIRNSTSYLKDQAPQIGRNFLLGVRTSF
ncbi:MAG: TonB-dependent receptor [Gammaproteobacteria bacterium]|jgi:iron complex outermembrane receptor protein|nr:TonB-dependent receptor [Gammaproteobacteria bacterium]